MNGGFFVIPRSLSEDALRALLQNTTKTSAAAVTAAPGSHVILTGTGQTVTLNSSTDSEALALPAGIEILITYDRVEDGGPIPTGPTVEGTDIASVGPPAAYNPFETTLTNGRTYLFSWNAEFWTVTELTRFPVRMTDGRIQDDGGNALARVSDVVDGGVPASESTAGIIELATEAEAIAGTDDTRALTPLKGSALARSVAHEKLWALAKSTGYVRSDGVTNLRCVVSKLNSLSKPLSSDVTVLNIWLTVPSDSVASDRKLFQFSYSTTNHGNNTLRCSIYSNELALIQQGPTGAWRKWVRYNFRAAYSAQLICVSAVIRPGQTNPEIYVNGVLDTSFSLSLSGSNEPDWMDAGMNIPYLSQLTLMPAGDYKPGILVNSALTAAEVLEAYKTQKVPGALGITRGQTAPTLTPDTTSADAFNAVRATEEGNIDGVSDGSTSKDNCYRVYADATASASHYFYTPDVGIISPTGKKVRIQGWAYIPSSNTTAKELRLYLSDGSGSVYGATLATAGAWTEIDVEVTLRSARLDWHLCTLAGNQTFTGANSVTDDLCYVTGITYTPVGTILAPDINPAPVLAVGDTSGNGIGGYLVGNTPVRDRRDFSICGFFDSSNTAAVQFLGSNVFSDYSRITLDTVAAILTEEIDFSVGTGSDPDAYTALELTGPGHVVQAWASQPALSNGIYVDVGTTPGTNTETPLTITGHID